MKARLVPIYYETADDPNFVNQVNVLRTLLSDEADIIEPVALGSDLPESDAVVFPQMLGDAFRKVSEIKAIPLPKLVITSEFGTVSMWDWEINRYLHSEGIEVIAPYKLEQTKLICRMLSIKRELSQTKFLVYQDNPGEGYQADIFKRFYWWEDECTRRIQKKFGVGIIKKSYKALAESAQRITDLEAELVWKLWQNDLAISNISLRAKYSAIKLYLAIKRDLEADSNIKAVGINCLNESRFSDSTPCLAWNLLFQELGLIWGCEADTVSMLTEYLINKSLKVPVMMTNLYPFLMGQAALKHEKIPDFPSVSGEPANHILAAHCGYLGVVPQPFATEWTLRKKVLAIVDDNATVIDARLPVEDITLVKLDPTFDNLSVIEGAIEGYAQFPGSDCLNGAVIRVRDGRRSMNQLSSHHYVITMGCNTIDLLNLGKIFGLQVNVI